MAGEVDPLRKKLPSPGLWRSLNEVIGRLRAIDPGQAEERIRLAETMLRDLVVGQQEVRHFLSALVTHNVAPPLISPLELASGDRFALEDRCRALTSPVYIGDNTALCRMLGYYKIYLDTNDTGFASHLLLDGFWEMWLTVFFARNVRPAMTVIDVGANYGYYTLLFGALVGPEGRVYAVEPNPAVLPKLRHSVSLNGLDSRTTIVAAAAGGVEAEVNLFAPHGEPKNSMIIGTAESVAACQGTVHQVRQITADRFAAGSSRIDFIKIDAEGAEEAVITGMMNILLRDRPRLILEFNAARYVDPGAFLARLRGVYDRVRYIDFDCEAAPVTDEELLRDRWGEDWMLYLDQPSATPEAQ